MAANPRHSYPLAELARIYSSGKRTITTVHNNWCPTLNGLAECTCGDDLEYRIVRNPGGRQR